MLLYQSGVQLLLYILAKVSPLGAGTLTCLGYFPNYNPQILLGIAAITTLSFSPPLKSDLLSQTQLHGHHVLEAKVKQRGTEDEITGWRRTGPQIPLFRNLCDSTVDLPCPFSVAQIQNLFLTVQIKVSSGIRMPGSVSFHPSQLQCLEPDSPGHSRVSTDRKKQE